MAETTPLTAPVVPTTPETPFVNSYKIDGKYYDVPTTDDSLFQANMDMSKAEKVYGFMQDGKKYRVPEADLKVFQANMPKAKPFQNYNFSAVGADFPTDQAKPQEEEGSFFGNLGHDFMTGIKKSGYEIGRAVEDQSLMINDMFKSISDNPAWQNYWNKEEARLNENIAGLKDWDKTIGDAKGGVGGFIGGMLPMVGLAAAAIVTKSPTVAMGVTDLFAEMGYGGGIDAYDKFKAETGGSVDPATRTGAGLLYGAAMTLPIAGTVGKMMPKGILQKSIKTTLDANPQFVEVAGKKVFEQFLKEQPTLARNLMNKAVTGAGHGMATMTAMEMSKLGVDKFLIGKDVSVKDVVSTLGQSALSGAFFGLALAPFSVMSQNSTNRMRREKEGSVTVSYDPETGESVEIIAGKDGGYQGLTPSGKLVDLTEAHYKNAFTMPTELFNQTTKEFQQNKAVAPDIERQAYEGNITNALTRLGGENGVVHSYIDDNGNTQYILGRNKDGQIIASDINGLETVINPKDVEKAKSADVGTIRDALMKRYDEKNNPPSDPWEAVYQEQLPPLDPRQQTEADAKAYAQEIANKDDGMITTVQEISEDNATAGKVWYVKKGNPGQLDNGSVRVFDDTGEEKFLTRKQLAGEPQEMTQEDFVAFKLQEFDQQQAEQQAMQQNQMIYNGKTLTRQEGAFQDEEQEAWFDENNQPVNVPTEIVQAWEKKKAGEPQGETPNIVTRIYNGKEYQTTKNPDGSHTLPDQMGLPDIQKLRSDVDIETNGQATVIETPVEGQDPTQPMFTASIVPVQNLTEEQKNQWMEDRLINNPDVAAKAEEAEKQKLEDEKKAKEPGYTYEGEDISPEEAEAIINLAGKSKDKSVMQGLEYHNDPKLDKLMEHHFPKPKPSYTKGKDKLTAIEARVSIRMAKTPTDLNQIKIENDEELQAVWNEKAKALTPKTVNFSEPEGEKVPETEPENADNPFSVLFNDAENQQKTELDNEKPSDEQPVPEVPEGGTTEQKTETGTKPDETENEPEGTEKEVLKTEASQYLDWPDYTIIQKGTEKVVSYFGTEKEPFIVLLSGKMPGKNGAQVFKVWSRIKEIQGSVDWGRISIKEPEYERLSKELEEKLNPKETELSKNNQPDSKLPDNSGSELSKETPEQVQRKHLNAIQDEFGEAARSLAKNFVEKSGIENPNFNRIIETARQILKLEKVGSTYEGAAAISEAMQYEFGYVDNFEDLRNAINKGGYAKNKPSIDRMLEVGVKVPQDILDMNTPQTPLDKITAEGKKKVAEKKEANGDVKLKSEPYSTLDIDHETPSVVVAKQIKADLLPFSKALAKALGFDHGDDGHGKVQYSSVNLPPAGGEATMHFWNPENPDWGIMVRLAYEPEYDRGGGYNNYKIKNPFWRVVRRKDKTGGLMNNYFPGDISASDLAKSMLPIYGKAAGRFGLPKEDKPQVQEPPKPELSEVEKRKAELIAKLKNLLPPDNTASEPPAEYGGKPQLNFEIMNLGSELAMIHIQTGKIKFADFAKEMVKDLGNPVKPYLKYFYNAARNLPGMDEFDDQMDDVREVNKMDIEQALAPVEINHQKEAEQAIDKNQAPAQKPDENNLLGQLDKLNPTKAPMNTTKYTGLTIETVSEKAFVVKGNTKPFADDFKTAGAIWMNKHQGWMFPKSRQSEVELKFGIAGSTEIAYPPNKKKLVSSIMAKLAEGIKITNGPALTAMATEAGLQAGVDYKSVKELYDIAGSALNQYILSKPEFNPAGKIPMEVKAIVEKLNALQDLLPTETQRSAEQVELQQYSTPPAFAFVVNWIAQIDRFENVLEPSAGEGNIAVFARLTGANVIANEIDDNRLILLRMLGLRAVKSDAKHVHLNPAFRNERISTVVMNPPFSKDIALGNKMDLHAAEKHIESALAKLLPGGRLVAIVGRGMSMNSPTHKAWWDKILQNATVRANIAISGDAYKKKGTSFDNRLLVIDKLGASVEAPFTAEVENYDELVDVLKHIVPKNRIFKPSILTDENTTRNGQGQADNANGGLSGTNGGKPNDGRTGSGENQGAGNDTNGGHDNLSPQKDRPGNSGVSNGNSGRSGGGRGSSGGKTSTTNNGGRNSGGSASGHPVGRNEGTSGDSNTVSKFEPSKPLEVEYVDRTLDNSEQLGYDRYTPEIKVVGSQPHPTLLVESTAMASVNLPKSKYRPHLSPTVIKSGALSDAQLEDVILAGGSHVQVLPSGYRRGYFLGGGTGYGKGRTVAAIIMDNFNQGRKKAVWLSANEKAHYESINFWDAVGGDKKLAFSQKNPHNRIAQKEGLLLTTYGTLRTKFDPRKSYDDDVNFWKGKPENRMQQIAQWLGPNFDGVIIFDESHNMSNAEAQKGDRGMKKASLMALAGIELQKLLPDARIVYASATGATEVSNLVYAQRLGLWGDGTPFNDSKDFVQAVQNAGVAGMEIISKDLKSMGLYTAKQLSFEGVAYETLEHKLLPMQTELYNQVADAWQMVLHHMDEAIDLNNTSSQAKAAAKSQFWGAHQRFFGQIIMTMQMPTVIRDIEKCLSEDKSVVIQLVSTNEAATNRALAEAKANLAEGEELDYEDLDLSPKGTLLEYLRNSFPIHAFEEVEDDNGNVVKRLMRDDLGQPIVNPAALALRDKLLAKLDKELTLPESPLDILINHFGVDNIAEVTGRTRRVVKVENEKGEFVKVEQTRTKSHAAQDKDDFMDAKKRILAFSKSGGTGASYHSDLSRENQQQRVHFVIQTGWKADDAVQGFGRSHRSNQRIAPIFKLVTTDLKSQRRYLSSVARRLDQLGALTKGQRQTGGQGILDGSFNLEGQYAKQALFQFYRAVEAGEIPGVDMEVLENQMALKIYTEDQDGNMKYNENVVFNTTMFLNRIMSLRVDLMDSVFDGFMDLMGKEIDRAKQHGTFDEGIQVVNAFKTTLVDQKVIYTDENTGGKTYLTTIELEVENTRKEWGDIEFRAKYKSDQFKGYYQETSSERIYAVFAQPEMTADGTRKLRTTRQSVVAESQISSDDLKNKYVKIDNKAIAERLWNADFDAYPATRKRVDHIVKGLILPIWNRLPNNINVRRYVDENGNAHLGRYFNQRDAEEILNKFKITSSNRFTTHQAVTALEDGGKVKLANGFELVKTKYQGLPVYMIKNVNSWSDRDRMSRAGANFAVTSAMSQSGFYYLPAEIATEGIDKIIQLYNSPITRVTDSEDNAQAPAEGNNIAEEPLAEYKRTNDHEENQAQEGSSIDTQLNWSEDVPYRRNPEFSNSTSASDLQWEALYNHKPDDGITYVERQLNEQKHLTFGGSKLSGPTKITSPWDVAHLFKNLESAPSENAFAVLHNEDGTYKALYLSTGTNKATQVDTKLIIAAAKEFGAKRVTFVHNHPSGNLLASEADKAIHGKLLHALDLSGVNLNPSIIINLDSGKFAQFTASDQDEFNHQGRMKNEAFEVNVYQFDRQELYIPSTERGKVVKSGDVAAFLSNQKRGIGNKIQALILDNGNNINRYVLLDGNLTTDELAKELLFEVGKYGEKVVLASNFTIPEIGAIKKALKLVDADLVDVLEIKQDDDIINNYKSFADEGLLWDSETPYGKDKPGLWDLMDDAKRRVAYKKFNNKPTEVNDSGVKPVFVTDFLKKVTARYNRERKDRRAMKEVIQGMRDFYQDKNLPIRRMQELVQKRGGELKDNMQPFRDIANSFGRLETLHDNFTEDRMVPILKTIAEIGYTGMDREVVLPYVIAKHTPELNQYMRNRDFEKWNKKHQSDFIKWWETHQETTKAQQDEKWAELEQKKEDYWNKLQKTDYAGIMPLDVENGFKDDPDGLAKAIVHDFETVLPQNLINELWDNLKGASSDIVGAWHNGKQITADEADEYRSRYNYYVPLRGWREGAAQSLAYVKGKGFGKSLQHAEGRKSLAANPLAYLQHTAFQAITEQVTNEVNTSLYNLVTRNYAGNRDIFSLKKAYYVLVEHANGEEEWELSVDPITDKLVKPAPEMFAEGRAITKLYNSHKFLRSNSDARQHEVIIKGDEEDAVIVFEPQYLPVAQAMNKENFMFKNLFTGNTSDARRWSDNPIVGGEAWLNNAYKANMTSRNPIFSFTNFIRDIQEAPITSWIKGESGISVIGNLPSSFGAILRGMRGKSDLNNEIDRHYDNYRKAGGVTGYSHQKDIEQLDKKLEKRLKRIARKHTISGKTLNVATGIIRGIEAWSNLLENDTRFAVYLKSIKAGKTIKDAAYDARNYTVDFNTTGKITKFVDANFAFFKVAMNSLQKNGHLFRNYTKRALEASAALIVLGILEALMNDKIKGETEDSDYYNLNEYVRDNYLILPDIYHLATHGNKGDKYWRFPLPQFWRSFKSLGTIIYDVVNGKTTAGRATGRMLSSFGNSLFPIDLGGLYVDGKFNISPIVPTIARPISEVLTNTNYMGYRIRKEPFTKKQEELLANSALGKDNVNQFVKFLTDGLYRSVGGGDNENKFRSVKIDGQVYPKPIRAAWLTDWNPSNIEHVFTSYLGGTGKGVADLATTLVQVATPGAEIDFNNIPFVNAFIRKTPPAKWKIIEDYYDLQDEIFAVPALEQSYFNKGDYEKYVDLKSDPYLNEYAAVVNGMDKALTKIMKGMDFKTAEGSDEVLDFMKQTIDQVKGIKQKYKRP